MAQPRMLTVTELTRYVKGKLEQDALLGDVWVRGELSNFKHHSSGHMYFTLKDSTSQLKSAMFASANRNLKFFPKEGLKVLARGNIGVYERDGAYQFYVAEMQPDGIGNLFLAFEQLKQKLSAEGLFDPARKRPLPKLPQRIGVITSPTGAVIRDILMTVARRFPPMPVLIHPVPVQGAEAPAAIARAIERMNELAEVDVLIVGRGGGSIEDLWAFNDEAVARAIAASRIPIIAAVGHETDVTIADYVADLRAATPTAAAELAVPQLQDLRQHTEQLTQRMARALNHQLERKGDLLRRLQRSAVLQKPENYLIPYRLRLDGMLSRLLGQQPSKPIEAGRARIALIQQRLRSTIAQTLRREQHKVGQLVVHLDALSPLKVMARGYGLIFNNQSGKLVKSVADVTAGDTLNLQVADGTIAVQVEQIEGAMGHDE